MCHLLKFNVYHCMYSQNRLLLSDEHTHFLVLMIYICISLSMQTFSVSRLVISVLLATLCRNVFIVHITVCHMHQERHVYCLKGQVLTSEKFCSWNGGLFYALSILYLSQLAVQELFISHMNTYCLLTHLSRTVFEFLLPSKGNCEPRQLWVMTIVEKEIHSGPSEAVVSERCVCETHTYKDCSNSTNEKWSIEGTKTEYVRIWFLGLSIQHRKWNGTVEV